MDPGLVLLTLAVVIFVVTVIRGRSKVKRMSSAERASALEVRRVAAYLFLTGAVLLAAVLLLRLLA